MNKFEMVELIAGKTDLTKAAASRVLEATLEVISSALQSGDSVVLINFGTFTVKQRSARDGRNPQTGEKIKIKATKVVSFKAGKSLKDAVKHSK